MAWLIPSTSSRNRVPLWANSNNPGRPPLRAPVNAPSSYPKSSLSSRFSGMAATLIATKGPSQRPDARWTAWANSSLPVPVSPISSTGDSVTAIFFSICFVFSIDWDVPITSSNRYLALYPLWSSWLRSSFWRFSSSLKGCRVANAPMHSPCRSTGTRDMLIFTEPMRISLGSRGALDFMHLSKGI